MDRLDQLLRLYERHELSRRELLGALAALGAGATVDGASGKAAQTAAAQGRTLNHVSLGVADLRRST